jgi:ribosomal protein S18 acetylase RimI-like enzyme
MINIDVKNVTFSDIGEIFRLYKIASDYQKAKKKVVVWPDFKRELVETEIEENRQFKMLINGEFACVWAITFSDEQIWEERNKDSAIYIHRIATNPNFRGNNFVFEIVKWAKKYATEKNIQFVRLDTLGNNIRLIEHYKNAGFNFLGMFDMKNTSNLPAHYQDAPVCLFEINLLKT